MNNWRWDNPCAVRDQFNCSNPQSTSSEKDKCTSEHCGWDCSNDLRALVETPRYQQYKPGNFLSVSPLNLDEIISKLNNRQICADPRARCCGNSRPGDGNENDNCKCEEDTQGCANGTGKGKWTPDRKRKEKATEYRTGQWKGNRKAMEEEKGKEKANVKGKGIVILTPRVDDSSNAVVMKLQEKM